MFGQSAFVQSAPAGVQSLASGQTGAEILSTATGANGSLRLDRHVHIVDVTGATANNITLPVGTDLGQEKVILLRTRPGAGNLVVSGTFVGGTTYTFSAANQNATMRWNGAAWAIIAGTGALT